MNRSTPGLPVHHQLLKSTQAHVHWVGDAIQPSHASQNGYYQKVYKQWVLERVQRKGNPLTLLVEMQTSTATMEDSVEIP